jgi:hypothetical protein
MTYYWEHDIEPLDSLTGKFLQCPGGYQLLKKEYLL